MKFRIKTNLAKVLHKPFRSTLAIVCECGIRGYALDAQKIKQMFNRGIQIMVDRTEDGIEV